MIFNLSIELNWNLGDGHPDAVLVNVDLEALSIDFSGGPFRFGTLIPSSQGSNENNAQEFRVQNSLVFGLNIPPANFPLVNTIYETETSTYMYTTNGPIQVQDRILGNTVDILSGIPTGFST